MTKQVTPNADLGRKALKHLLFGVLAFSVGALVMAGGLACSLAGMVAVAIGKGGGLLGTSFWIITGGAGAATVSGSCLKHVANRNMPHLQELVKEERQKKLDEERKALAARETEAEKQAQEKLRRTAEIEFNAQASTRLGQDVKTMRPLKLNVKPTQTLQ